MLVQVPFPGAPDGMHVANTPVKMEHAESGVRDRAPMTDEHATEILIEFGFSPDEIRLLSSGP